MTVNSDNGRNGKAGVQDLDAIVTRLNHLHDSQSLSWRKISARSEYQGIPAGTLCAIAKGREPKKIKHRKILGLPVVYVPALPCDDCGEVHIVGWCTEETPAVKGRTPQAETRVRIAADVTEEQRQALHEWAALMGFTWSEYCRWFADGIMNIKETP
jgi:hypothetical protein